MRNAEVWKISGQQGRSEGAQVDWTCIICNAIIPGRGAGSRKEVAPDQITHKTGAGRAHYL